jgi:hypothetical protein
VTRFSPQTRLFSLAKKGKDTMRYLGSILPRSIALLIAVVLCAYLASVSAFLDTVPAWGLRIPSLVVIAPRVTSAQVPGASTQDVMPSVASLTATPLQADPLDTVTFAATVFNRGVTHGPYRATLQLLSEHGGQRRGLSQSGFMLRHDQRLTLYWVWRAGASLPPGLYDMRLQLSAAAKPQGAVAGNTARQRLAIVASVGGAHR